MLWELSEKGRGECFLNFLQGNKSRSQGIYSLRTQANIGKASREKEHQMISEVQGHEQTVAGKRDSPIQSYTLTSMPPTKKHRPSQACVDVPFPSLNAPQSFGQ